MKAVCGQETRNRQTCTAIPDRGGAPVIDLLVTSAAKSTSCADLVRNGQEYHSTSGLICAARRAYRGTVRWAALHEDSTVDSWGSMRGYCTVFLPAPSVLTSAPQ